MQKLFAMDLLENITTISALPTLDPITAAEWEHWVKFACISFLAVALPNKWHTASVYNVDIVEAVGVESGAWEFLILVLILI